MRRSLSLAVLTALLATACTGGAEDDRPAALAAEALHRVDAALGERPDLDPDEVVVPEGCRLVVETDEYGFETEIVVCDDPATTTTTTTTEPPGGSTSTTEPAGATTTTTEPPAPTTTAIAAARPPLEGWGGSEDARTIARRLRRVVVEQSGCEGPRDLISLENFAAVVPAEILDPYLAAIENLRRSADACNTDAVVWREALEAALDHLEAMASILGDANG